MKENLGKFARDKITGFEGTITVYAQHLYGCDSYVITPRVQDNKPEDSRTYDVGRIEIIGDGTRPEEVASADGKKGPEDIQDLYKNV